MTEQRYERVPRFTEGDRLRKSREMTGLGQREFADKIGVSHQTITNAEKGHHAVRKITRNAWALATGVPVEWLEFGMDPIAGPPDPGVTHTNNGPHAGQLSPPYVVSVAA